MEVLEFSGLPHNKAPFLTVGGFLYKTVRNIPNHPYGKHLSGNSFPMDFICPSARQETP